MLSRSVLDHPFAAPVCICLLVTLTASSITAASVRGASPHLLSHYDTNVETFRCLDGSKSIPRSRVNDDYCDCLDGSDEPGLATQFFVLPQQAHQALKWGIAQAHPLAAMGSFTAGIEVISHLC